MSDTNDSMKCKYSGRVMVPSSWDPEGYECPNDCEFEKAAQRYRETLTQEELDFFSSMDPPRPYQNHCWKCRAPISSEFCEPDPGYGYKCRVCGKSLREWKLYLEGRDKGIY
jgi:hypothetical protein